MEGLAIYRRQDVSRLETDLVPETCIRAVLDSKSEQATRCFGRVGQDWCEGALLQ